MTLRSKSTAQFFLFSPFLSPIIFFSFLFVYLSRYFVLTMVYLCVLCNKLLILKKHEILARVRVIIVYKLHKSNRNFIKFSLLT